MKYKSLEMISLTGSHRRLQELYTLCFLPKHEQTDHKCQNRRCSDRHAHYHSDTPVTEPRAERGSRPSSHGLCDVEVKTSRAAQSG